MANYTTSATVVLQANGAAAKKTISLLEQEATRLRKRLTEASNALNPDAKKIKSLQQELTSTEKMLRQMRSSAASAEQVLSRLDSATPKDLQRTLRTLQSQLNSIQRGSAAWDAQVAKIRRVKTEIDKVNSTLAVTRTTGDSVGAFFSRWGARIMGVTAALGGLIAAGKAAVASYSEMDEKLADTRKFTGMTAEQVRDLNDAFKQMDTRTARTTLNELAQEAGRLGKTTKEDILGYVQAADIINVALSDLGEGATQSIAKLSNIFKLEDEYGTYDSMLKIGSVVNVLSQNCTASKPYLVEFANRLAGVGNMAHLSLQNIIGLGAVLDSNAQKVEAASTAVGQVITRMYRDPAKYAKVAGLDVANFTKLLKDDANEALLVLLETLGKAGDMDVLSPMFADMGENGSRVIATLSTLSKHINEVRDQQRTANEAFDEGTSVLHEYEIFNNTVQAAIDKAKKRVTELAVELGEKLYPLMKHIYTSSGVFMRMLNTLVDFTIKYKREIIVTIGAIAAYNVIMLAATARTTLATKAVGLFHGALKLCQGIIPAVKLILTALINSIQYFTNGLQVNYDMQQRWRKSMEAMKLSSWVGLILAAASAIYLLSTRFNEAKRAAEDARKEAEEFKKKITDLDDAAAGYCAKEIDRLDALYKTSTDEAKATDERREAAERLQKLYPDYFKNLSTEEIMVGNAKTAYDQLRDSIIEAARARAAAAKIEENEKELLTLEQQAPELKNERDKAQTAHNRALADLDNARRMETSLSYSNSSEAATGHMTDVAPFERKVASTGQTLNTAEGLYQANVKKQEQLNSANAFLRDKYNISAEKLMESDVDEDAPNSNGGSGDKAKDKFAAEKDWKAREEAMAMIARETGTLIDEQGNKSLFTLDDYTARMDEIAIEFYKKQLAHKDLSATERLEIEAAYQQAISKEVADGNKLCVEEEKQYHAERVAGLQQHYADGRISTEAYNRGMEELEVDHLRRMALLTTGDEQVAAQQALQKKLLDIALKRQKEAEAARKKASDEEAKNLDRYKGKYFGDNAAEKKQKYDTAVGYLDKAKERELAAVGDNPDERLRIEKAYHEARLALAMEFDQKIAESGSESYAKAITDVGKWLEGDGGKALKGALSFITSEMGALFSQLTAGIEADLELQTAAIEKRYERETTYAEGNTAKVKRIEAKKEADIAKAKNEANKKMFAMQVIQAVAQTATNAINAYGSAAAIPVIGHVLAPIAAATAIAAGMLQVANIKKQQKASEAQGYADGGFTPDGGRNQVAGVVHAGEWVASQKLVRSPQARPLIDALEYAQRTNTIGSLRSADVSRAIAVPQALAVNRPRQVVVQQQAAPVVVEQNAEYAATMSRLASRLEQPFVTVNSVTGDDGMKQAQDRYNRLISNKTPKKRKR